MKRRIFASFLAVLMLLSLAGPINTYADILSPGDPLGYVLHTDIRVFINDVPIMGYNINGWTYVVAEDLQAYGLDVVWDGIARTLSITLGTPRGEPSYVPENPEPPGSIAFPFVYTDIITYVNGEMITSYNMQGFTVVRIDDIAEAFGAISWDGESRRLYVTITDSGVEDTVQGETWLRDDGAEFIRWAYYGEPRLTFNAWTISLTVIPTDPSNILHVENIMAFNLGVAPIGQSVINWALGGPTPVQPQFDTFDRRSPWIRPSDGAVFRFGQVTSTSFSDSGVASAQILDTVNINVAGAFGFGFALPDDPGLSVGVMNDFLLENGSEGLTEDIIEWLLGGSRPTGEGRAVQVRAVPLWYYYQHYRNPNPRPATSNRVWARAVENFINNHARPNTTHGFPDRANNIWPTLNTQLDALARNVVQTNFANDNISHAMPFNAQFWTYATGRPNYYFWVVRQGDTFAGLYGRGRVGTGLDPNTRTIIDRITWNTGTMAHEIGHSLGLHEHLAHFFDEMMLNSLRFQHHFNPTNYRSSMMDWIMQQQAGQVAFLRAIFWGNDTYYRQIWYDYIYPVLGITFENMQLARSATEFAAASNDSRITAEYNRLSYSQMDWFSYNRSASIFQYAFDTRIPQTRRAQYARQARQIVNDLARLGKAA
jgi:hypothetical protein